MHIVKSDQKSSMVDVEIMNNRLRPALSQSIAPVMAHMKLNMFRNPLIRSCVFESVTAVRSELLRYSKSERRTSDAIKNLGEVYRKEISQRFWSPDMTYSKKVGRFPTT